MLDSITGWLVVITVVSLFWFIVVPCVSIRMCSTLVRNRQQQTQAAAAVEGDEIDERAHPAVMMVEGVSSCRTVRQQTRHAVVTMTMSKAPLIVDAKVISQQDALRLEDDPEMHRIEAV